VSLLAVEGELLGHSPSIMVVMQTQRIVQALKIADIRFSTIFLK